MANKKIDLAIKQNIDTNFVIYDISDRYGEPTDYIPYYIDANNKLVIITIKLRQRGTTDWNTFTIGSDGSGEDYELDWENEDFVQSDFLVTISLGSVGETSDVTEGTWELEYYADYLDVGVSKSSATVSQNIFAFKQTEIYHAQRFEEVASTNMDFDVIKYRIFTDKELNIYSLAAFSTYYYAMIRAVSVGAIEQAENILDYLEDYIALNPIEDG